MSIGERIKALRLENQLTQEKLAELLSISPQAVSRWETGAALPDISLLPPLANLFGVTTDHLLGMDTYEKDLRKAAFDEAFFEYHRHDDKEKNYKIAVQAAAEYPGNMEYVEWLASAEYYVAIPQTDHGEYIRLLESSVSHYRIVLDNARDRGLLDRALHGAALALCMLGRKEEAREYALKIEDRNTRDGALYWCLEGEERIVHSQRVAEGDLNRFIINLTFASPAFEAYDAAERILEILFPDGNYQHYHNVLQYAAQSKAVILCREARYAEALEELRKAKHHAERMTEHSRKSEYRFTSPLFDRVSGEKLPTDSPVSDLDDFRRYLDVKTCFDAIRDREEFKALYA